MKSPESFQTPLLNTHNSDKITQSWWHKLTKLKPKEVITQSGYKKTLNRFQLTLYGIGNTIGAGIFALTGIAVQYAGPSLWISFGLAGLMCLSTALMYAELMSKYPTNGSAFGFVYSTFGELPAWIIGWYLLPRYGAVSAALARAMSSYLVGLCAKFGIILPTVIYNVQVFGIDQCCPLAILFLMALCGIQLLGTRESERFNTVLTIFKIFTLLVIILVAFYKFEAANMTPFFVEGQGLNGTVLAASIVFFGVMGFDFVSTLTEEAINPKTDIPHAMRDSVISSTIFYVFIAVSMCGMGLGRVPNFIPATAMADQFKHAGLPGMSLVIYICAFLGITACCFTCLMGFIRLIQAFANDGLLPQLFTRVSPTTGIPVQGSLVLTALLLPLAFFQDLEQISKLISLSQLLVFSFVSACGLCLRYSNGIDVETDSEKKEIESDHKWYKSFGHPGIFYTFVYLITSFISAFCFQYSGNYYLTGFTIFVTAVVLGLLYSCKPINLPNKQEGHYEAPFVPILPAISIYFNFILCWQLDQLTWMYLFGYTVIGLLIYFIYGIKNSKVQN